jgi:hypothetical protein
MHVLTSNITLVTLTDASIVLMQICDARPHLKYYTYHTYRRKHRVDADL